MSEPFDPPTQMAPGLVPAAEDARDPALIFVIAVLCFLACLTALGVIAGDRAAHGWAASWAARPR
jgi:cell division transport system permease protein